ncbi:hypothetical protein ACFL2K_05025, partial [Candidatus Margulisiibacteriota bacterium]
MSSMNPFSSNSPITTAISRSNKYHSSSKPDPFNEEKLIPRFYADSKKRKSSIISNPGAGALLNTLAQNNLSQIGNNLNPGLNFMPGFQNFANPNQISPFIPPQQTYYPAAPMAPLTMRHIHGSVPTEPKTKNRAEISDYLTKIPLDAILNKLGVNKKFQDYNTGALINLINQIINAKLKRFLVKPAQKKT